MMDPRARAAKFYDAAPNVPEDVSFYRARLPSVEAAVLELGCGTGRVLLPLAEHCRYVCGLDLSPAMISICREKLKSAGIPPSRARAEVGDITDFGLGESFDLIIAPYRVLQNLETGTQVEGLFSCVRRHLAPGGRCILNVFNPRRDRDTLAREGVEPAEKLAWEVPFEGGRLTCHSRSPRMDADRLILYPELVYRHYIKGTLSEEAVLKIVMRCYYPEEFLALPAGHGFEVVNRWGGYAGEKYSEGPELVLEFESPRKNVIDS